MAFNPSLIVACVVGIVCLVGAPACAHAGGGEEDPPAATQQQTEQPSVAELESRARARELGDRDYPHHDYPREVSGEPECPEIELVEYTGEVIPYNQPIEVNEDFRERLKRFEELVSELATKVYGRPPSRVVHAGGHTCKTVGARGEKLSEHAFGHAIDVLGFEFDDISEGDEQVARTAKKFSVRLADHWDAEEGFGAKHSLFLHLLADALKERGPFSTMLGPAYKGHDKMFHFDFGPQFFFRI
ncbi:MAG: extensin family protein [Persicimonas sp.]